MLPNKMYINTKGSANLSPHRPAASSFSTFQHHHSPSSWLHLKHCIENNLLLEVKKGNHGNHLKASGILNNTVTLTKPLFRGQDHDPY